ncbi:unnamed protein product [Adineta steineri]|uniref:Retinol dehydrogenase 13-like protein n=1 Tax=Adineta steineri TaxID=433720 RepID=A0A818JSL2_9BILA|nr:unnamed protein product [Adineta steineri]
MRTVTVTLTGAAGIYGGLVLYREYFVKAQYTGNEQLFGKTAIVTGANTGIGKEVAHDFARRGARVIMACRDMKKCEQTREKIVADSFNTNVVCRECDLSSIESIKRFADDINQNEKSLHLLINNAGVMWHPSKLTKDGFEQHLGVNYLGHFLLTNLLIDKLSKCSPSRIVNVTSPMYKRGQIDFDDLNISKKVFNPKIAYEQASLAIVLATQEFCREYPGSGVIANCVNPGITRTEIARHTIDKSIISRVIIGPALKAFMKTPMQGAQGVIQCALDPQLEGQCGKYFNDMKEEAIAPNATNEKEAKRLWLISERWTRLNK